MTSPALEVRNPVQELRRGPNRGLARCGPFDHRTASMWAITGPAAAVSQTLLHMLGGLDSPTAGEVLFRNVSLGSAIDLDTYRSRNVWIHFQAFHLMPTLRAIENVQVPMLGLNRRDSTARHGPGTYSRKMGLENRMGQYPNQLSAGERQTRCDCARLGQ